MDIWEILYKKASEQYCPVDVSPFVTAHHVACAIEAENGEIYTGFCIESCSGVMNLCAERVAALNMYLTSGQTRIKRLVACRDEPPAGTSRLRETAVSLAEPVGNFCTSSMNATKIWKFLST